MRRQLTDMAASWEQR